MKRKSFWEFFKKGIKSLKMQLNDWRHKRTKLMIAVRDLNEGSVKELLRKVDVNEVDKDGNTALMYMPSGCIGKDESAKNILDMLVEAGVDLNKLNKSGKTALMQACEDRDYEMTKCLLDKGADLDIENKQKKKAMHYANSDDNMRNMLMYHIKDIEIGNGMDPYWKGFSEVIENDSVQDVLNGGADVWVAKLKEKSRFNDEISQDIRAWASENNNKQAGASKGAENKDTDVKKEEIRTNIENSVQDGLFTNPWESVTRVNASEEIGTNIENNNMQNGSFVDVLRSHEGTYPMGIGNETNEWAKLPKNRLDRWNPPDKENRSQVSQDRQDLNKGRNMG